MNKFLVIIILILPIVLGCKDNTKGSEPNESQTKTKSLTQQTIYFGGDIITMDGKVLELAEAVVAQNEEIVFVGSLTEAKAEFPDATEHNLNEVSAWHTASGASPTPCARARRRSAATRGAGWPTRRGDGARARRRTGSSPGQSCRATPAG